jgi:hypothetical protein
MACASSDMLLIQQVKNVEVVGEVWRAKNGSAARAARGHRKAHPPNAQTCLVVV